MSMTGFARRNPGLLVVAMALSGCGGGNPNGSGTVTVASAPAPAGSGSACTMTVAANAPVACKLSSSLSGTLSWSFVSGAQEGMVIQPKTGQVRWTPMAGQTGSFPVQATVTNGTSSQNRSFTVTVNSGTANPAGIYVAGTSGNDTTGNGTAAAPYKTIRKAAQVVNAGQTIWVRGGTYRNSQFGTPYDASRSEGSAVRIADRDGTASQRITLRNFGNEYVKVESDVGGVALVRSDYWTIQGLEIAGNAKSLNYEISMQNWWNEEINPLTGRGVTTNSSDNLIIKDCVIHDFPGVGVSVDGAEFATVDNNIVYGNAWWSTGGVHGISLADLTTTSDANAALETIKVTNNVSFANESQIISHVFTKGNVDLAVDEGNGLHLQNNGAVPFRGKLLVENNRAMYNGKSGLGLNTIDRVTIRNNAFYFNARTVNTGEISLQSSNATAIQNNLFQPRSNRITIKDFQRAYVGVLANATVAVAQDAGLYPSVQRLAAVFVNPAADDYTAASGVPAGMGVPNSLLSAWRAKLDEYGIVPYEATLDLNASYLFQMKKDILDSWPVEFKYTPGNPTKLMTLTDRDTEYVYERKHRCSFPDVPVVKSPCTVND